MGQQAKHLLQMRRTRKATRWDKTVCRDDSQRWTVAPKMATAMTEMDCLMMAQLKPHMPRICKKKQQIQISKQEE